jgi:hypothetical protein
MIRVLTIVAALLLAGPLFAADMTGEDIMIAKIQMLHDCDCAWAPDLLNKVLTNAPLAVPDRIRLGFALSNNPWRLDVKDSPEQLAAGRKFNALSSALIRSITRTPQGGGLK